MHTIGEFKGNAVITLKRSEDDQYGFTFGLAKAKLILENLEAIQAFYSAHKDKKPAPNRTGLNPNAD
ncbi:MAG: hypothetical protein AB1439_09740 [candidate division FCPU426 bacterium]